MFQVYYMFAVLNYAEFGSWEEVKMNAPQALEEYQQFMKELPDDERVRCLRFIVPLVDLLVLRVCATLDVFLP